MWPVTDRFTATLPRPHDVLAYCDLLVDGAVALTVDGSPGVPLLTGGRVTVGPGAVQRTATLNLADPWGQLVPVVDAGLIVPRTGEIRVWAGVRYADASPAVTRPAGPGCRPTRPTSSSCPCSPARSPGST
jgi:hypothetical protein